jgi:hypothetical protein
VGLWLRSTWAAPLWRIASVILFFGTTTRYEAVPFYFYPTDSCSRGLTTQDY